MSNIRQHRPNVVSKGTFINIGFTLELMSTDKTKNKDRKAS